MLLLERAEVARNYSAEVDLASARDNREKAHRKVGSRSSIGSIGELEAFSPAHSEALLESHASADAPTAAAGREAGLSSVDDMVQAFGTLVPDTVADASEQHHRRVASGAAAEALSHASEPAGRVSGGAAGLANVLLPPELAALTGYLYVCSMHCFPTFLLLAACKHAARMGNLRCAQRSTHCHCHPLACVIPLREHRQDRAGLSVC